MVSTLETSSDTSKLQPSGANFMGKMQRRHSQNLATIRLWCFEVASILAAAGIFAAIVAILVKYDGQQLPKRPYNINLNTLIALLTLCLRAALAFTAVEIIGQLKWKWFSDGPRSLANFQTFDEASRGLLGSLKLISLLRLSYRGSPLAVIAALTSILSLAISPFTQQAIKTVPCPHVASIDGARIPVAMNLPGVDGSYSFGQTAELQELGPMFKVPFSRASSAHMATKVLFSGSARLGIARFPRLLACRTR
ncbi:hypothetical protein CDD81_691 [Ophiocordyceps australis]|uniref:Uncharacterized protein n=1 Tax=Ophiocordyceps australis TaxID=1399860 RepID=A0A2C5Y1C7_9HYPO|nr:hypothetical protein CDD81_691 [Ophiocordyceps australis]